MTTAAPVLQPWSWHKLKHGDVPMSAGAVGDFAAEVVDIAAGVECVLEVVHLDEMRRDGQTDQPAAALLSDAQREAMLRLAILSARRLAAGACEHIAWAQERAREHEGGGRP